VVLAGRGVLLPAAVLGLCAGAMVADLRLEALAHTNLRPLLDRSIATRATLLEAPSTRTTGTRAALVRLVGGVGAGEVVLLRAPPWARWDGDGGPAANGGRAAASLSPGREVAVSGEIVALPPREEHARRQGAHALLAAEAVRPTGARRAGPAGALDRVRERAEAAVSRGLPRELGALARGMVLGQDDALGEDLREAMRTSALAHLVSQWVLGRTGGPWSLTCPARVATASTRCPGMIAPNVVRSGTGDRPRRRRLDSRQQRRSAPVLRAGGLSWAGFGPRSC